MTAPNVIWTADYKGQFRLGDGRYCFPLTVQDGFSRYLLECRGLTGTTTSECRPVFQRLFQQYGLPEILRTDNGVPFATGALARLSQLSVWWIRLGVYPELIEPSHPEQNGRHERMHRTLKRATTRPPAPSTRSQQQRFDVFRDEYNDVRPHEALKDATPASLYERIVRGRHRRRYCDSAVSAHRLRHGRRKAKACRIHSGAGRAGRAESRAAEHFDESISVYEIEDAVAFVFEEARRLRASYPAVLVAPLLYRVEDDRLLQIVES